MLLQRSIQRIAATFIGCKETTRITVAHDAFTLTTHLNRKISTASLLMARNRLANEKSSYLLQHANNPVDWYPWGNEAFEKAKTTNRPIFLSIGYSTCHWCHVMAHESFENEEVAKFLNENFISIKVDREERPDVDKVYMAFVGAMTGGAGWPLSVFLTPDLKPFTGGMYFPPHDAYGRPGFMTLLNMIATKWRTDNKELVNAAETLLNSIKQAMKSENGKIPPLEEVEKSCYNHLNDTFDEQYKGFAPAPKFPKCVVLEFLLCFYSVHANSEEGKNALRMVGETLMAMNRGGIHDHIGKGFHRYSVDARWHVPHFEKMLYDQAQLLAIYAVYCAITGELTNVIEDIVDYTETNLMHKFGGFCNAEDADSLPDFSSEKKYEGAYYAWTEKEIDEILKDKPINDVKGLTYADVFKMYYNVKSNGNVPPYADPRGELKSRNILMIKESHDINATKCMLNADKLQNVIDESKVLLREVQKKRPKPHLDNKILTSWNGLMISGLAKAAITLQNEELSQRAQHIVDFIKKYSMTNDRLLRAVYVGDDGEISESASPVNAYADDYAFLIQGLLDLYEASFDEQLIKLASKLQEQMDDRFWDKMHGSGYHQTVEDPHIILRIIDDQDGAKPSINSVASLNLVRLYGITNQKPYNERAQKIFESAAERLRKYPFILAKMICALQRHILPPKQVIVVGSRSNEITKQMLSLVTKHFDCVRILISLDPEKDLWLQSINSHLKQLVASTSTPTVYICENFACTMPITSVDELKNRLNPKGELPSPQ